VKSDQVAQGFNQWGFQSSEDGGNHSGQPVQIILEGTFDFQIWFTNAILNIYLILFILQKFCLWSGSYSPVYKQPDYVSLPQHFLAKTDWWENTAEDKKLGSLYIGNGCSGPLPWAGTSSFCLWMVVIGWWLDLIVLEVFSNLNDSMILWYYETCPESTEIQGPRSWMKILQRDHLMLNFIRFLCAQLASLSGSHWMAAHSNNDY